MKASEAAILSLLTSLCAADVPSVMRGSESARRAHACLTGRESGSLWFPERAVSVALVMSFV